MLFVEKQISQSLQGQVGTWLREVSGKFVADNNGILGICRNADKAYDYYLWRPIGIWLQHSYYLHTRTRFAHILLESLFASKYQGSVMIFDPSSVPHLKPWLVRTLEPMYVCFSILNFHTFNSFADATLNPEPLLIIFLPY